MDSMILGYSFAAAIAISACVVALFSQPIDEALSRVISAELAPAWRRYVKFALFTVTFAGGMRLKDFAVFVMLRGPAGPQATAAQGLLQVFQTVAGSLISASAVLLAFFLVTLAIDASMRVFWFQRETGARTAPSEARAPERPAVRTDRQPVGAERHSGGKDRQRSEDSGRLL